MAKQSDKRDPKYSPADTVLTMNDVYRQILHEPAVRAARDEVAHALRALPWEIEVLDIAPDGAADWIRRHVDPLIGRFLEDSMGAFDFGWQPFEIVFDVDNTCMKMFARIKALRQEMTDILVDEHGTCVGLRQDDVTLPRNKSLIVTYPGCIGNYFGVSGLEPARPFWQSADTKKRTTARFQAQLKSLILPHDAKTTACSLAAAIFIALNETIDQLLALNFGDETRGAARINERALWQRNNSRSDIGASPPTDGSARLSLAGSHEASPSAPSDSDTAIGGEDEEWSIYMTKGNLSDILDCDERKLESLYGAIVQTKGRQNWRVRLDVCDTATVKRYEDWRRQEKPKKKPRGTSAN